MSTNPLNFSEDPKAETFEAAETRAEKQKTSRIGKSAI